MKRKSYEEEGPKLVKRVKINNKNIIKNEDDVVATLQKMFITKPPLTMYNGLQCSVMNDNLNKTTLINLPEITLSYPLIDLNLVEIVKNLELAIQKPPNCRSKPVMLTVRGQGGGKTRALEEVRRLMIKQMAIKRILVLGITFGNNTEFEVKEEYKELPDYSPELCMAYSILVRMCFALFDYSFEDCKDFVRNILCDNEFNDTQNFNYKLLIRGFIRYSDILMVTM